MQCRKLFLLSMLIFVLFSFSLINLVWASSMMWSQTYGGIEAEMAYSLVETSDGGYAIAGYSLVGINMNFWLIKTDEYGIIPEFPSWIILPLFLTATLVIVFFRKRLKKGVKSGNYL